ncbi:MAG: metallophosphoesterase [Eubacteriales bacterium]|nr:metallophosphoesterase [Eubacteriales bacterium]
MKRLECSISLDKTGGKARILVISDSHGDARSVRRAVKQAGSIDWLIHCGDVEGDLYSHLPEPPAYAVVSVRGNCDYSKSPDEIVIKAGYYRIYVTHGDHFSVHQNSDRLLAKAKSEFADIALYGHIHVPEIEERDGILIVNPGSLSRPRQYPRVPTYAILTISEDELPKAEIFELSDE